jgi:hypothetical protein
LCDRRKISSSAYRNQEKLSSFVPRGGSEGEKEPEWISTTEAGDLCFNVFYIDSGDEEEDDAAYSSEGNSNGEYSFDFHCIRSLNSNSNGSGGDTLHSLPPATAESLQKEGAQEFAAAAAAYKRHSLSLFSDHIIPVQCGRDEKGTVSVDLHAAAINIELKWYFPKEEELRVCIGSGHAMGAADEASAGLQSVAGCGFFEATQLLNNSLKLARGYDQTQPQTRRGKFTLHFMGHIYHLMGYDSYVMLWAKTVYPYRGGRYCNLPLILGLYREKQQPFSNSNSTTTENSSINKEQARAVVQGLASGTDRDLVCLRHDIPHVDEWVPCAVVGDVSMCDAPVNAAALWQCITDE